MDGTRRVRVKDLGSHAIKAVLISRALLVKIKRDIENQSAGSSKILGCHRPSEMNVFAVRAAELAEARPELAAAVEPLLKAREAVERQIADLDRKVMRLGGRISNLRVAESKSAKSLLAGGAAGFNHLQAVYRCGAACHTMIELRAAGNLRAEVGAVGADHLDAAAEDRCRVGGAAGEDRKCSTRLDNGAEVEPANRFAAVELSAAVRSTMADGGLGLPLLMSHGSFCVNVVYFNAKDGCQ